MRLTALGWLHNHLRERSGLIAASGVTGAGRFGEKHVSSAVTDPERLATRPDFVK